MSATPTKISPLRHLVNILSDAVTRIDEKYASAGLEFPTLDKPFDEKNPACLMLSDPDVVPFSSIIVAAADQLIVSARHPMQAVLDVSQSYSVTACLRLVCETNVTEILREAGSRGLHVNDIAAKTKLHPGKLARALRLLATHHLFAEVSPDVFTNNSLSSVLDTGKPTEDLFSSPKVDKFKEVGAHYPAYLELMADEALKSCAFVTDVLLDPATSHSDEPSDTPFSRVFKTKTYFDYLYAPGNQYQCTRFHVGMNGIASSELSTVFPGGLPWETLQEGTKIVDVGGGIGSACYDIMKKNPLLKFVVQDLPNVIDKANGYWNDHEPKAIADGQVTTQAHDFFGPQPVKDADIFLLRYILHNWPTPKAVEILKLLREAATPGKTKLVIIDGIIQYACAVDKKEIPGAEGIALESERSKVPDGLLANLGRAEARNYYLDLIMFAGFNAQERTLRDYIQMTEAGGWRIKKIYSPAGRRISHVLAEAI